MPIKHDKATNRHQFVTKMALNWMQSKRKNIDVTKILLSERISSWCCSLFTWRWLKGRVTEFLLKISRHLYNSLMRAAFCKWNNFEISRLPQFNRQSFNYSALFINPIHFKTHFYTIQNVWECFRYTRLYSFQINSFYIFVLLYLCYVVFNENSLLSTPFSRLPLALLRRQYKNQ